MANVINMGMRVDNAKMCSPEAMLADFQEELKQGDLDIKKVVILYIDGEDRDEYKIGYRNAGMSSSEVVCLLSF